MPEILLAVVTVALLVERFWTGKQHAATINRLLNQVAAKNTHELVLLNKTDLPTVKSPVGSEERDRPVPIGV